MATKRTHSRESDYSVSRKKSRGARGAGPGDRDSSQSCYPRGLCGARRNDTRGLRGRRSASRRRAGRRRSTDSRGTLSSAASRRSESNDSCSLSPEQASSASASYSSRPLMDASIDETADDRLTIADKLMSAVSEVVPALGGELAVHVHGVLAAGCARPLAQMLRAVARFAHIMPTGKKTSASDMKEKGTNENGESRNAPEVTYIWTPSSSARRKFDNSDDTLVSNDSVFDEASTSTCNHTSPSRTTQTILETNKHSSPNCYLINLQNGNSTHFNLDRNPGSGNNFGTKIQNSDSPKVVCDMSEDPKLNKHRDPTTHMAIDDPTEKVCCDTIQCINKDIYTNENAIIIKNGVLKKDTKCDPVHVNGDQISYCDLTLCADENQTLHTNPSWVDLTQGNDGETLSTWRDSKPQAVLTPMDLTLEDCDDDDEVTYVDNMLRKIDHITSIHEQTLQNDDEDIVNLFPEVCMPNSQKPETSSSFGVSVKEEPSAECSFAGGGRGGRGSRGRPRSRGRRGPRDRPEGLEERDTTGEALMAVNNMISSQPMQTSAIFQLLKDKSEDAEEEEMCVAETYAVYTPAKLKIGCAHPDPVVETASLSSVEASDVTYQLSLPETTVQEGKLSALQLEAVVYASQAHEHLLPDGSRAGFLIGDGAGVGKGRTIAGIIFENYLKGRKRAVWVSVSNDLKYDAERDLRDIGAEDTIRVHQLNKMKYGSISSPPNGSVCEGVVFSTYSSLIGYTASAAERYNTRLKQIVDWCGLDFDGCIVFDECHRAKNLCPVVSKQPSKTGLAVVNLQRALPKARLVYASATGASEPKNMAYMVRLGIWGKGTPFHTFEDFLKTVEKRGVGAMEIVAMDLKLRGMYIARQLSFHGVTFRIEEVPLNNALRDTYDKAVALWVEAVRMFEDGLNLVNPSPMCRKVTWSQFWGAHQRFFKYLCIAAKVPCVVARTLEAVEAGKCVVIGLQSTGEARTLDQLGKEDGKLTEFICTAKGVFQSVVEKQFPDPDNMKPEDFDIPPSAAAKREAKMMKNKLLKKIAELGKRLPPNTLDQLVDLLGGEQKVAEMTGRRGRVVQTASGAIQYESRANSGAPLDMLNVREKQAFMDGEKDVAIISEAASSGISLQSDRRAINQKRRVHITLELPWSADRAIQQFGRTHRSNQVNAPEYIFLISDLAGERRFASTVAKRLESLGALTHGDRRATETRDLSQFNIENKIGRETLSRVRRALNGEECAVAPPRGYAGDFLRDAAEALQAVGLSVRHDQESADVQRFLNRLLGVPVRLQNALFQHFSDTFDAVLHEAKRNGRYDPGIQDLGSAGECVRRVRCVRFLWKHATGTAPVELHTVLCERGLEWSVAEGVLYRQLTGADRREGFYLSRARFNNNYNAILCVAHTTAAGADRLYNVYRPNVGLVPRPQPFGEIAAKYAKCSRAGAAAPWRAQYEQARTVCTHRYWRGSCAVPGCEVGLRTRTFHVLSGSVLGVWARLDRARMQVVRVRTERGDKIVGTLLPKGCIDLLTEALKKEAISFTEETF